RNGVLTTHDENMLGGGQVSGLLRFQNTDLVEGRNLLGRLSLAISTEVNAQHQLGLDLNGKVGGNLFTPNTFTTANILAPSSNTPGLSMTMAVSNSSQLAASDYELDFSSATTGTITRRSDNTTSSFSFTPGNATTNGSFVFTDPVTGTTSTTIDGLALGTVTTGTPAAGDRFLLKPFITAASSIKRAFSTPSALAVASPVVASVTNTNSGSLSVVGISAKTVATTADNYTLSFHVSAGVATTFDIRDLSTGTTVASAQPYVAGQAITYAPATSPATAGWTLTLTGAPADGDVVSVGPNPYPKTSSGNASAITDLRDMALFDGAALTDGYAGLISQIGIRTQSANYATEVSTSIATNLEKDRTGVSGVNLDEEAAKLLQYQQAYQASAKTIQIAQSIFDTLIQSLSR
ncbi:MAG: FlgK family flagellar hook-associated protein, partial [Rhodoferax sp.]